MGTGNVKTAKKSRALKSPPLICIDKKECNHPGFGTDSSLIHLKKEVSITNVPSKVFENLNMYTDGSVGDNQCRDIAAGCGIFFDWKNVGVSRNISRLYDKAHCNEDLSAKAELAAICLGLEHLVQHQHLLESNDKIEGLSKHVMIWTDSAIALQSIKCYCQNTYTGEIFKLKADIDQKRRILERIVEAVQQLYPIRVTMRKVGAHRGIRGNEIADRLARIGRVQPVPIHVYHDVGRKVMPAIDEEAACIDRILKLDHQLLLDNTSASFSESCRDSTNRASEIDDTGANWCLTKQKRLSSLLSPKPSIRDMESDWRLTKQKISLSRRLLLPKSSSITANYENLSLRPQTAQTLLLCSV